MEVLAVMGLLIVVGALWHEVQVWRGKRTNGTEADPGAETPLAPPTPRDATREPAPSTWAGPPVTLVDSTAETQTT